MGGNLLRHQWARWVLAAILTLLILLNIFHLLSFFDRRQMHADDITNTAMLRSRAVITITLFTAMKRDGVLRPDEIELIETNWEVAGYGLPR